MILPPIAPHFLYNDGDVIDLGGSTSIVVDPDTTLLWDSAHAIAAADAVAAWSDAFAARAAMPGQAHLAGVTFSWTIAGPDVDPDVVANADIVVAFTGVQDAGGRTVVSCTSPTAPVLPDDGGGIGIDLNVGTYIVMNEWFVFSFTPADTFNIMLHEFGHALGIEHIDVPVGDTMNSVYPHTVGNVHTPRECLSNLDVAQAAAGFAWLTGVGTPGETPAPTVMPASAYAKQC